MLVWSLDLPTEVSLDLESSLVFIDSEFFEKIIEFLLKETFQNLELHHIVVIGGVLGFDFTYLSHRNAFELGVELLDFLRKVPISALLMDPDKPELSFSTLYLLCLFVESDKFITETKPCSTFWLHPLGSEWGVGRGEDIWSGVWPVWVREEALWLE